MQVPSHIICDICGRPKGETNHWLAAITIPANDQDLRGIAFAPIDTPVNDPAIKKEHICGQACAHKRFSQWLETLTA